MTSCNTTNRRRFLAGAGAAALAALDAAARAQTLAPAGAAGREERAPVDPGLQQEAAPALAGPAPEASAVAVDALRFGEAAAFSFEGLVDSARRMAAADYVAPDVAAPDILERIDYDAHGRLRFRSELALYAQGPGAYPLTFFHLGRYFRAPVRVYAVEGATAREIEYDPRYFDMPADSPARALPVHSGFAGLRFQESRLGPQDQLPWQQNDWIAFLGASYFRTIGELHQYGMSARGIAIDTAIDGRAEEFPAFTHFYVEEDPQAEGPVVCALLDGPSVTGAYRFRLHRAAGVGVAVEAEIFLRRDVARLGIAPLTSMFWYSETERGASADWRTEVHDSDGLAMWTGTGERLWRPLVNPAQIANSVFSDRDPRGFGLLQRDRNFDHYLDGVHYEARPSVWVEPLAAWGEGSVQLVELPTAEETNDNIVAMWVPKAPARAGNRYRLDYRMYWQAEEPSLPALARCVATRLGSAGQPGQSRRRGARKFVVEFQGEVLAALAYGERPEPLLGASRGSFADVVVEPVPDGVAGHWRAHFDLVAEPGDPVELRLQLRLGDAPLTETWLYQYRPVA